MIGYTMVGCADLARATAFYDPVFAIMGLPSCWRDDQVAAWGRPDDRHVPRFFVCLPFDGRAASVGNGAMTAFQVPSTALVDRLHALALRQGGSDEGAPGIRERYGPDFYVAYVRDPDGNKLAFSCYASRRG